MTYLKLPSTIAGRQMNLLFDAKRSEGMSSAERDKVVLIPAQILMQAAMRVVRQFRKADSAGAKHPAVTPPDGQECNYQQPVMDQPQNRSCDKRSLPAQD